MSLAERDLSPRTVRILPPELCDQIAAGEVLERPSSAVKELVENALDAGATFVSVELEGGGRDLIRVTDNGSGMGREDAERALLRHATSKIRTVDDLMRISTLGFRGEALASIASVSRMEVLTQTHDALSGTYLSIAGGKLDKVRDSAAAAGTQITIRDLFFNTPARLKFLKRDSTEVRRVQEALQQLAMSAYDVQFRFSHNGRVRFDVPAHKTRWDRIYAILGGEKANLLYEMPELPRVDGVTCRGYFGEPSLTVRGQGSLYTFVNGRFIKDRTIVAAIRAAYRELLPKGRYPVIVAFIDVPYDAIDVNVHPTKIEVRFHNTDALFKSVFRPLRDGLATAPWASDDVRATTYTLGGTRLSEVPTKRQESAKRAQERGHGERELELRAQDQQQYLSGLYDSAGDSPSPTASSAGGPPHVGGEAPWMAQLFGTGGSRPDSPSPLGRPPTDRVPSLPPAEGRAGSYRPADGETTRTTAPQNGYFSRLRYIGQYARAYLLASDNRGLVVVDQHAAHERISFERLRDVYHGRDPLVQQLLFPMQLELDALRAATLEEHLEFFSGLGFEIEPFGGQSFAIKAVPTKLAGAHYATVLEDALDDLADMERTSRFDEAFEAVISRIACHGSVRAGDDLTPEEAYALFAQMDEIDFRGNCPHGRPVYFQMDLEELEQRFDRR